MGKDQVVIKLEPIGQDLPGRDPTGRDPTRRDPTGRDPTGRDPPGRDPTGGDPTGGDLTGGGLTGRGLTGRDRTRQDGTGPHRMGQDPTGRGLRAGRGARMRGRVLGSVPSSRQEHGAAQSTHAALGPWPSLRAGNQGWKARAETLGARVAVHVCGHCKRVSAVGGWPSLRRTELSRSSWPRISFPFTLPDPVPVAWVAVWGMRKVTSSADRQTTCRPEPPLTESPWTRSSPL